ncbi:MAG: PepSY-associated TM helix domain-containing protein [Bacteroidota bacterium]
MEKKDSKRNYNVFFNTHTVSGIVISVGLFVCFFAGAFALFLDNINTWEANKKNETDYAKIDYERVIQVVEEEGYEMDGRQLGIFLRDDNPSYIQVNSQPLKIERDSIATEEAKKMTEQDSTAQAGFFLKIDPDSYEIKAKKFDSHTTQLGTFLYHLHYFEQIPTIGIYLAGLVSIFFLFAIVTGIVVHWKKIISNFFTFRLKASFKNLWTDAHTALGVIGLPFQFMYAVSGSLYGLTILIFIPSMMILFDGDQEEMISYIAPGFGSGEMANKTLASRQNVNQLVDKAVAQYDGKHVRSVFLNLTNFNDENAQLNVSMEVQDGKAFYSNASTKYSLATGEVVSENKLGDNSYTDSVILTIHKLHFAQYGGYFIKAIYFILALITCFVILSGVMVWLEARDNKKYEAKKKFNTNVGAIYLGICMGLFPAIAFFFCITKIFPSEMENRFGTMSNVFFTFWIGYTLYAYIIKDFHRINKHALLLAGAMGLAIPILNGLQSGLWPWISLSQGYVDTFFIDISWFFLGLISLTTALSAQRLVAQRKIRKEKQVKEKQKVEEEVPIEIPVMAMKHSSSTEYTTNS